MLRTPNFEPSTTWTSPLVAWVVDSRVRLPPEAWPPLAVLGRAPWTATITASSGLEGSRGGAVGWGPGATAVGGGIVELDAASLDDGHSATSKLGVGREPGPSTSPSSASGGSGQAQDERA